MESHPLRKWIEILENPLADEMAQEKALEGLLAARVPKDSCIDALDPLLNLLKASGGERVADLAGKVQNASRGGEIGRLHADRQSMEPLLVDARTVGGKRQRHWIEISESQWGSDGRVKTLDGKVETLDGCQPEDLRGNLEQAAPQWELTSI